MINSDVKKVDLERFYFKKTNTSSRRSSLSLDAVLVQFLEARLGSKKNVRRWISAQAKIALQGGMDDKSLSRRVQENAIRIIADPSLFDFLNSPEALEEVNYQNSIRDSLVKAQNEKRGRPSKEGAGNTTRSIFS